MTGGFTEMERRLHALTDALAYWAASEEALRRTGPGQPDWGEILVRHAQCCNALRAAWVACVRWVESREEVIDGQKDE